MKKNIRILILAAILGLIALSFIQGYLINNTYKLKKEVFIEETKRSVSRFDDELPKMDSIYDRMGNYIVRRIIDYKLGLIKKEDLLTNISLTKDSLNSSYINLYQTEFKKRQIEYPVKFQKRLKSIVILDTLKNDTLFFQSNYKDTAHLLGEVFDAEGVYKTNNSQTSTDLKFNYEENGFQKILTVDFQVITEDFINIDGWKRIVLSRMSGILLLSICIFTFVLGLLYYAIKSLITQKKIADIKTDFINNITHELKTPLATLSLATKMLKNDAPKLQPDTFESTVKTIDRQSNRLQKLIDQVLNNSLGYQEIKLHKEQVKIDAYLNTILDDFILSIKEESVIINRNIKTNNKAINLDKFYITTAILNILENATKYNTKKVIIDFNVKAEKELLISIKDNGIGISDKDQKQLFDKFFRAGNKEIHDVKGLGLGLYYTNQIIKAHNGNIKIDSKKEKGSIFTISIPLT